MFSPQRNTLMKSVILSSLTPAVSLSVTQPASQDETSSRSQKAQAKRQSDIQDALKQLRSMPSPRVSAKLAATQRATMLKHRLDVMKQMLIGATPTQAKAIAAQIKAIASELAGMAKTLAEGGGASSTANASATPQVTTGNEGSTSNGNTEVAEQTPATSTSGATNQAGTGHDDTLTASQRQGLAAYAAQNSSSTPDKPGARNDNNEEKSANEALKKALDEAKTSLQHLIAMLKNKTGNSKKAAHDIVDAEARLRDMERSMAQAGNAGENADSAATAVSQLAAGAESSAVTAVAAAETGSGTSISINVAA